MDPITFILASGLAILPVPEGSAVLPTAEVTVDDGAEAVAALIAEYSAARSAFMEKYQAAETDEARQALFDSYPNPGEWAPKFQALAEKHPGGEAALAACGWVINSVQGPDAKWAREMMIRDFFDSLEMKGLTRILAGDLGPEAEAHLTKLMVDSPHREVRGHATYQRAMQLKMMHGLAGKAADDPYVEWYTQGLDEDRTAALIAGKHADAMKSEYTEMLESVQAEYDDVMLYGEMSLAAKAEGDLYEENNLQIGMVAPDIEGVDAEGVSFRLYDYKGQVVVLDFWGFW